jgi:hypothetical protein
MYAGGAALPLQNSCWDLPGLYALAFFCMNATQQRAHIHLVGLVWMPPSGSLSLWHLLQKIIFCILFCIQGFGLIDRHQAPDSESMELVLA